MNVKVEKKSKDNFSLDILKWCLISAVFVIAIISNNLLQDQSILIRLGIIFAALSAALFLAYNTQKGQDIFNFLVEAKNELRKVIWPSKQESTQTTLIVLVVTVIMGVLLWMLDWVLIRAIGFITGIGVF